MPFQSQGKGALLPIIKNETKRHIDAFEFYYQGGEKRSMRNTATHMGVSVPTIQNWARSFDWKGRIVRRDQSIATRIEEEIVQISSERLANWEDKSLELIERYLTKAQAWIDNPRTYLRPEDFERIMNVLMKLKRFESEMNQPNNAYLPPTIIINQPTITTGFKRSELPDGSGEVIETTALPAHTGEAEDPANGLLATPDTSVERELESRGPGLSPHTGDDRGNGLGEDVVRSPLGVETVHVETGDTPFGDRDRLPETRGARDDVRNHEVPNGRPGESGPETSGTGNERRP